LSSPTIPAPVDISDLDFLLRCLEALNVRTQQDIAGLVATIRKLQRHLATFARAGGARQSRAAAGRRPTTPHPVG
jgi:hypothetical protein